jgi:ribose 5-phosphate isomerase B
MRIALGADHAGVELKAHVTRLLAEMRIPYEDFGTLTNGSVDYPDFAAEVAGSVASGRFDRGILVCGSGIGMAIAAAIRVRRKNSPKVRRTDRMDEER